jgi:hypothetical protein
MKAILSTAAVVIGLVLLLTSLICGVVFSASSGWTEEKSLRMRELSEKAHVLGGQIEGGQTRPNLHGGRNIADLEAEYKQVTAELKQLGDEAEGKIEAPKTASRILRYSGIAFVIAGGLVIFANRG